MNAFKKLFTIAILLFITLFVVAEEYVVQKGDTYYSISKKYNISLQELYDANGIKSSDVLKFGQILKIPVKNASQDKDISKTSNYTVASGDTLYSISKKYNTTVDELRKLNNLDEKSILKVGQQLFIPGDIKTTVQNKNTTKTETKQVEISNTAPLEDVRTYETEKKGNVNLIWPVKALDVTYVSGKIYGVAIKTERNSTVSCIQSGKVIYVGLYRGYGQVVFVQSDNGYLYVYSGLEKLAVENGERVSYQTKLGTAGIDTLTQKAQIILMIYKNGKVLDPATAPRGK